MSLKKRLIGALGANITTQLLTSIIQISSVPIFLKFWGVEQYGNWIIIAAIPTYFAMADFGFLAVAMNRITILYARNEQQEAERIFQTAIALWILVLVLCTSLSAAVSFFLNVGPLNSIENSTALVLLVIAALMSMSGSLVETTFRANGRFAYGINLANTARLVEWVSSIFGLVLGRSFLWVAVGQFVGRLTMTLVSIRIASKKNKDFRWGLERASYSEIKTLAKPSLSFLAFPLANSLNIQGITLAAGYLFGASFLALLNTYRTLTRTAVQGVTIIGRSLWPEISRQAGLGNRSQIEKIYRVGTAVSLAVAGGICGFLLLFGEDIIKYWTGGKISYIPSLFHLFLVATIMTSLWQMGMVVLSSINKHMKFSLAYLCAAIFSLAAIPALEPAIQQTSVVISMITFEALLIIASLYFVKKELKNE